MTSRANKVKMLNTYKQTVEYYLPKLGRTIYTMDLRPVCPVPEDGTPKRYRTEDGTIYTWWKECVIAKFTDGSFKTWWNKPTLADAVNYSKIQSNICDCTSCAPFDNKRPGHFQFFPDKSVFAKCYGAEYYWSEPLFTEPIQGVEVEKTHWCCLEQDHTFNEVCHGYCEEMNDGYATSYDSDYETYAEYRNRAPSYDEDDGAAAEEYSFRDGWNCRY